MEHGPAWPPLQSMSQKNVGPKMAAVIWIKKIWSDACVPSLRSKLNLLKFICLNKIWHRWAYAQCFLKYFSFDSWERWPPSGGVCALSLTAWRAVQACFGGWVGFVGGFSVLSSDCQKWRLSSILDLRNSKSWWTRNLDIIIAQNFRQIIGWVIGVIYYTEPHMARSSDGKPYPIECFSWKVIP